MTGHGYLPMRSVMVSEIARGKNWEDESFECGKGYIDNV